MHKDKNKHEKPYIFSFNNSLKNSISVTPESSNNVSFQNPFSSSLKSLSTQPYYTLTDSLYPQLFHSTNNKENESWRRVNSREHKQLSTRKNLMRKQSDHFSSSKKINNFSFSKEKVRPALAQKNCNELPNVKFDLPCKVQSSHKKISLTRKESKGEPGRQQNIKVFIRLKPNFEKQRKQKEVIHAVNQKTIKIDQNYYCFDKVFTQDSNQQHIFSSVGELMCQQLFQGFNGTIFAYGQTGSGKTYTIFGEETEQHSGLIARCIKEILNRKNSEGMNAKIKCSMVELYKQQLIDMFGYCTDLKLKQQKNGEVYIEGLKEVYIQSQTEMMSLVKEAAKGRKVTSTKLNQESSRSHSILTIYLEKLQYTTKLCLIDLAGSEKVCKSGAQGEAFEQTKKINYSLSCLGNVINALTTRSKTQHIPFRDSKLTRLLRGSLTGNFLTSVIVNCSSSEQFLNQTISSLKFAERAKKVKINVQSLEDELKQKQTISQLHSIIKKLKYDLDVTTHELNQYKQQQKAPSKNQQQKGINPKKIQINIPLNKIQKKQEVIEEPPIQKEEERCHTGESELTARNPIPSERAHVDQNLKKYSQKFELKPHYLPINNFFLPEFSSLSVSKSIKKLQNSPDLSSLSFKYEESPDISLSFSIHGESARKQVFLNSPS